MLDVIFCLSHNLSFLIFLTQLLMECFVTSIVPLLQRIQAFPNTTIIWQDNPPLPDTTPLKEPRPEWVGKRNSFLVMVVNHFISTHLKHLGIPVVPLRAITMPWSEVLNRAHLYTNSDTLKRIFPYPPGVVTSYLLMHHACDEFLLTH